MLPFAQPLADGRPFSASHTTPAVAQTPFTFANSSAIRKLTDLPALYVPPLPLGFFCRFEDNLARKLPVPLDFGTD
jgi:hypothetical protein